MQEGVRRTAAPFESYTCCWALTLLLDVGNTEVMAVWIAIL